MIISYDAVMQDQPFYAHLYFQVQTVLCIWFKESFFQSAWPWNSKTHFL